MSDVLIRGMTMPKECGECIFCQEAWCVVKQKVNDYSNDVYDYAIKATKPDWCPLIELPPHGRLIDADAVERNLVKMQMAQKGVVGHGIRKSRAVVRDMATVIPADKDSET